jgi:hypothetical protein
MATTLIEFAGQYNVFRLAEKPLTLAMPFPPESGYNGTIAFFSQNRIGATEDLHALQSAP